MQPSMSLKYEPSSEPLHISVTLNPNRKPQTRTLDPREARNSAGRDSPPDLVESRSDPRYQIWTLPRVRDPVIPVLAPTLINRERTGCEPFVLVTCPLVRGSGRVRGAGPLRPLEAAASKRRANDINRFKDFHLTAKARIWPWLSYMCHIRSTKARIWP